MTKELSKELKKLIESFPLTTSAEIWAKLRDMALGPAVAKTRTPSYRFNPSDCIDDFWTKYNALDLPEREKVDEGCRKRIRNRMNKVRSAIEKTGPDAVERKDLEEELRLLKQKGEAFGLKESEREPVPFTPGERTQGDSKRLRAKRAKAGRGKRKVKDAGDRRKIKAAFWRVRELCDSDEEAAKIVAEKALWMSENDNSLKLKESYSLTADDVKRIAGVKDAKK